ncbi:MAG TPA: hypothetical protein VFS43_24630 [Polyangiaceae bacterium]|nr:hypothetical protein [Polyangiaceae bacterium]
MKAVLPGWVLVFASLAAVASCSDAEDGVPGSGDAAGPEGTGAATRGGVPGSGDAASPGGTGAATSAVSAGVAAGSGGPGVRQIAVGFAHSCALTEAGNVLCWGANYESQLGDGTKVGRSTPMPVLQSPGGPPLAGAQTLPNSGAYHTCVTGDGGALCWGQNDYGQLGDGTPFDRSTPVPPLLSPGGPPLPDVEAIATGTNYSCALVAGGEVRCWGNNLAGQLGTGTFSHDLPFDELSPVTVVQSPGGPPLAGVGALVAGGLHTCAWLRGDDVRCWGYNINGQLGDGTTTNRATPTRVLESPGGPPLSGVKSIALGSGGHSCAVLESGEARCWGDNDFGQLGDGTKIGRPTPVPVRRSPSGPPLTGVQALSLGFYHTCALLDGGKVRCWGRNFNGQLGDGSTRERKTPVPVVQSINGPPVTGAQAVSAGGFHTCAWFGGGDVKCWGGNNDGQLGIAAPGVHPTPVAVRLPLD